MAGTVGAVARDLDGRHGSRERVTEEACMIEVALVQEPAAVGSGDVTAVSWCGEAAHIGVVIGEALVLAEVDARHGRPQQRALRGASHGRQHRN